MKNVQHSPAYLRKRKMMMVLPVLVIPFITMAFWALGGGKVNDQSKHPINHRGLNTKLPDANLKENKPLDKLGFYEKADEDSLKREEWMRSDPYYKQRNAEPRPTDELQQLTQNTASKFNQRLNTSPYEKSSGNPEQKVIEKLALLEREMNKPAATKSKEPAINVGSGSNNEFAGQVDRLENMMQTMNQPPTEDLEIKQLEGTLEKILDIQHPQRVRDRIKEKSMQNKQQVFIVTKEPVQQNISLLGSDQKSNETGFYGIDDEEIIEQDHNTIEAVVHENQVLVNGAVVKLRLASDIYINGSLIPKGNLIFGLASLNQERLLVEIHSINNNNLLFPVKLEVYDMDGLPGIYIPGAITRDVVKQSADNALQSISLPSMDPSIGAQAASAGIETARNLLGRKVKLVKVTVKAGYRVLLKDKNMNQ